MAIELTIPSTELAERCLAGVSSDQRLVGLKMSVMGGSNPSPLYSLPMVASFLQACSYEEAMRPNSQVTIGYIDPTALATWLREVVYDDELADAIDAIAATGEVFGVIAGDIRELLLARVSQCKELLRPVAPAAEEE